MPGPKLVLAPAVLLWTLPLLLRARLPFAAPAFCFVVQAASAFTGDAVGGVLTAYAALLLTFWAVGAGNPRPQAVAGAVIGCAAVAVATARDVRLDAWEGVSAMVTGVAITLVAYAVQGRARKEAALERRATQLEQEREERERAVVLQERRRIARELHDVIAHYVSLMTVQAGAGLVVPPPGAPH